MTRGIILNHTVTTIIFLKLLFLLTTAVIISRIMWWYDFWTWSSREDYLRHIIFVSISRATQKMTVIENLKALRCCSGSKMSLLLRSAMKIWIPEIMLKLFKCFMKTYLALDHSWMISRTYLILKLSTSIISYRWKRSRRILIIGNSSMERQSQNIIIRRTLPTEMHKGI